MRLSKDELLLYAVTCDKESRCSDLAKDVEKALRGGATMLQLREKSLKHDEFLREALELKEICRSFGTKLIINDDARIAVECGADGLHIGQCDMDAAMARSIIGDSMILGVSAQTVSEALKAEADSADYLGVGTIFQTGSKSDALSVSFDELEAICHCVKIPTVAIGGIDMHNILRLKNTGIVGVAVISAIFSSQNIEHAAGELKELCKSLF